MREVSNGEVKDAERGTHELWCDTQNNISERCNCMVSEYIEKIEDHDRIVAELKAEVERLKRANQVVPRDAELLALNGKFRDTIAKQAKVIEKLTEQRNRAADRHHKQSLNKYLERIAKFESEIKAIERGEA